MHRDLLSAVRRLSGFASGSAPRTSSGSPETSGPEITAEDSCDRPHPRRIRRIDRRSLEALRGYAWPGNIRELQNVVERSVIVCEGEEFAVDESWLTHATRPLAENLVNQERELIEEALTRTKGRISGQSGAAALLGMPPSRLDSKIKTLKIDKRRFNTR
jgi:formate hydrogenlyase transcriptional activator